MDGLTCRISSIEPLLKFTLMEFVGEGKPAKIDEVVDFIEKLAA
jgi:hypothetical protein